MARIKITFEKTTRISKEYDVPEEVLEEIKSGEMPFWDELTNAIDENESDCDLEYNYAVNDEDGSTIVDWE